MLLWFYNFSLSSPKRVKINMKKKWRKKPRTTFEVKKEFAQRKLRIQRGSCVIPSKHWMLYLESTFSLKLPWALVSGHQEMGGDKGKEDKMANPSAAVFWVAICTCYWLRWWFWWVLSGWLVLRGCYFAHLRLRLIFC